VKNKLFVGSAIFVLAVAILGYVPDAQLKLYLAKNLALEWAVIAFIALLFIKNWWIKGFVLWSLIATIVTYNKWSFFSLYIIVLFAVFYQVLCDHINHRNSVHLLNAICVLTLLQITWMVLEYCGVWWLFTPKNKLMTPFTNLTYCVGFLANPNHSGAFLALALPAFFRKRWVWLLPIVLIGLVMARSSGAMVAGIIGTMVFVWFIAPKKRWLFVSLVLFAGAGLIWKYDLQSILSINTRLHAWKSVYMVTYWVGHWKWLWGWGMGQFPVSFAPIYQVFIMKNPEAVRWSIAHNEFIQLWFEAGLIGLGLVLGYLGHQAIKFLRAQKTLIMLIAFSGVIIAVVNANVNFLFHISIGIIPLIYLAILNLEVNDANSITG